MMEYLNRVKRSEPNTPRPHLILLDLNMPKLNGFQALEKIKTDPMLSEIPVVVFSSSSTHSDISSIYALGGNSYVTKPGGYQELKKVIHGIVFYWGQIGALPATKQS
jgi:CheY-like chemotaxis protein